jgi:phosphoribosylformylglycinamidine synthase
MHHPKRIMNGVVSGVRDYGNRMGIPTVNGSVYFDDGYMANPLVFCGTMGIIPKNKIKKKVCSGDLVLVVGGRTGRDGIHGATFSSIELDEESDVRAVQIGNPIVEKKVLDAMIKARDLNLYRSVTDCGAGGLSSAVGELGEHTGVQINLDKVPLKYDGLLAWEIWVSEAQERMVFAVPPKNKKKIVEVFKSENVEAIFIGEFAKDKRLKLFSGGDLVADMEMDFLHNGLPKTTKTAVYEIKKEVEQKPIKMSSQKLAASLKKILADLNVCSREWIVRQYDHEVGGQTIVKPLQSNSIDISGPGDAAVIYPYTVVKNVRKAIVLSNGINPEYGINSYKMAASAIEEAIRNAVCVGGNIERMSLLDNFCWGSPDKEKTLGSLVAAAKACYDFSKAFLVPFISGKDSLYNEYSIDGKKYAIPPTLLISAMGIIDDAANTLTMPFKQEGNKIFLLGLTRNEMAGSIFSKINSIKAGVFPSVYPKESMKIMKKIYQAINKGLIESCHDMSEGGIAVAVSEMAFSGAIGASINVDLIKTASELTPAEKMFSQSNGRFIVEVSPANEKKFCAIFSGTTFSQIGTVGGEKIIFESPRTKIKISHTPAELLEIWTTGSG